MRNLSWTLFLFLLFSVSAFANGVGAPMKEVLEDDFASFFNIKEQSRTELPLGQQKIHYKTGGFQEYIDLYMVVDKDNTLLSANIQVQFEFISKQKMLAMDVIKSFIQDFAHEQDEATTKTLAMRLFKGEGQVDPALAGSMQVLSGRKKWDSSPLQQCIFTSQMVDKRFEFAYHVINWTEKSIPKKAFLTEKDLKAYQLKPTQEEATFVVWTNYSEEQAGVPFQRLVDGHWAFDTPQEAVQYLRAHQLEQSEGMDLMDMELADLPAQVWVYESGEQQREMMAALGLDNPPKAYIFLIQKGQQVGKLFVMANPEGTLEQAVEIMEKMVGRL